MDKCGNGAGQTALHVADAAAIEFVVAHNRPERRNVRVPAVAQGDGIHMADIDESRLVALARHGGHKIAAPGEYFELCNLHGIEYRMAQLRQPFLNQRFDIAFNLVFIRARV